MGHWSHVSLVDVETLTFSRVSFWDCGNSCIDSVKWICGYFAALVSRQFMDMSRIRIEGLLAAFPKLVGSGKQHTYVETENVRYVYQPMETLFLLLVTNKQSNILEDLETLRLISKLVSTCSHLLVNPPTLFCYFCCCVLFSSFLSCESTAGG